MDDLKTNYRRTLEICLVISLLLVMSLLHAWPKANAEKGLGQLTFVEIEVEDIAITYQHRKPIPPPQPVMPVPMASEFLPEDAKIEETVIDLLDIPAPPPPPEDLSLYDDFVYIPHEIPPYPQIGFAALHRIIKYPEFALSHGIGGQVVLGVLVDENGECAKIKIIEASGLEVGFENAAIQAVKRVKWVPAKQREKSVKVWVAIPIKFEIVEDKFSLF